MASVMVGSQGVPASEVPSGPELLAPPWAAGSALPLPFLLGRGGGGVCPTMAVLKREPEAQLTPLMSAKPSPSSNRRSALAPSCPPNPWQQLPQPLLARRAPLLPPQPPMSEKATQGLTGPQSVG